MTAAQTSQFLQYALVGNVSRNVWVLNDEKVVEEAAKRGMRRPPGAMPTGAETERSLRNGAQVVVRRRLAEWLGGSSRITVPVIMAKEHSEGNAWQRHTIGK